MKYAINNRSRLLTVWLAVFLLLPGCCRMADWHANTFYQGETVEQFAKIPQTYIRSLYLYDQLSTVALFDALWLSDAVRTAYVSAHTLKTGKGVEFRTNFLRRQLEENKHFITFYLLSSRAHLDDKDSAWSFSLRVNGVLYTPLDIRVVDLNPEYSSFFGRRYNHFKTVYEIKFNALTTDEKPILDSTVREISLCIRSLDKKAELTWSVSSNKIMVGSSS
jgi:hypothetical protein